MKKKEQVVERYWPDYIDFCMRSQDSKYAQFHERPTVDGFWQWYITEGPMGLKHQNRYYSVSEKVKYV